MDNSQTGAPGHSIVIRARLAEVARAAAWLDQLVADGGISPQTGFAMQLCLEELLVNTIQHGFGGDTDSPIRVEFLAPAGDRCALVIEDEAPAFDPCAVAQLPASYQCADAALGGQGLRLLREFAAAVEYQAKPRGNRVKLLFNSWPNPAASTHLML